MTKVIPVMRVFDYDKTIEFYVKWLGFTINWEHRFGDGPFYMQVSLRDIVIDLSEHHGECSPGARLSISEFKDLKAYHELLGSKRYNYMNPGLENSDWKPNTLEMTVIDPFYNRIIFDETLEVPDEEI